MLAFFSVLTIVLLVIIDQLLKIIMEVWLQPIGSHPMIDGFLEFRYVENTGAAFGAMQGKTWFLAALSVIIIAVGIYLICSGKLNNALYSATAILVIAGGIGNLVDRIFRHYVVDFIATQFIDFPVFNFADCLITVGEVLLIVCVIYEMVKESRQKNISASVTSEDEKNG